VISNIHGLPEPSLDIPSFSRVLCYRPLGVMGIPFRVPIIAIPGSARYGGGPAQGLNKLDPHVILT
jgi:hypothetical protein